MFLYRWMFDVFLHCTTCTGGSSTSVLSHFNSTSQAPSVFSLYVSPPAEKKNSLSPLLCWGQVQLQCSLSVHDICNNQNHWSQASSLQSKTNLTQQPSLKALLLASQLDVAIPDTTAAWPCSILPLCHKKSHSRFAIIFQFDQKYITKY